MTAVNPEIGTTSEGERTPADERPATGSLRSLARRIVANRLAFAAALTLLFFILVAVLAPILAPYDPSKLFAGPRKTAFEGPSSDHFFGTDRLGRDNFSRLMFGARYALRDAAQVTLLALLLAVPIGLYAGFKGRIVDTVSMRVIDSIHAVPTIVLALTFAAIGGGGLNWALLGISIGFIPSIARVTRAATLSVRRETFIEASEAIGTKTRRVLQRRVLPNVAGPVIVQASVCMGGGVFLSSALSVLGVGYGTDVPTWGVMLTEAFESVHLNPVGLVYPGVAIALVILAFNFLGDGLRDAFELDQGILYGSRVSMGLTVARPADPARAARPVAGPPAAVATGAPLLSVSHLSIEVRLADGSSATAVDDVSFSLNAGEVLGLVGESGAGKTLTSLSIARLLPSPPFTIASGSVLFQGVELLDLSLPAMRRVRGSEIGLIFQDPMVSLNPAHQVGDQIAESVILHTDSTRKAAARRAVEMLDRVGIPDARKRARTYPHELSGGMRQRAMIAMALACSPKLLIADEPTTALDVTVQAQILELLRELQGEFGLSIIFVTHDLGVVASICDRVEVMYAGQVVESASAADLFARPSHPYTRGLLASRFLPSHGAVLQPIPGQVPPIGSFPAGCRFHPRCTHARDVCRSAPVELRRWHDSMSRCVRVDELSEDRP